MQAGKLLFIKYDVTITWNFYKHYFVIIYDRTWVTDEQKNRIGRRMHEDPDLPE